ncbi:hypothetical protein IFM89_019415 [Coptis chinensis]|uniref:Rab3-GAP regulatory subunit N-terminal domain-containing protein n=1 Tax=Coptis chinensis TaxID=261450 RepID=A0A835IQ67_9MAGN|nr:hypothetical protein IFM89_019415 [Coptis chinensis]
MARKTHLTEIGNITCAELTEFGAGKKENWLLENPNLLTSLTTHSFALANRSLILIINYHENHVIKKIKPLLTSIEGEITAIEWIVFDDARVILIGTSNGYLLFYSLDGDLIHKQIVHPGNIRRLRVRGNKLNGSRHDDLSTTEEVCVVMPGVIARFDGSDIKSLIQRWFRESHLDLRLKKREDYGRLPHQLWNVSKYGSCSDAAITGIMPPPLLEIQSSEHYYCAVTIGEDAVISAYRLSENRNRSIVGAILSKVVPAAFSTLSSVSKMIWRSEKDSSNKEVKPQTFAKASSLTCLKDYPRKGEKLTLSPGGTLAAITDSLGRILLLDTEALVVQRIWKGYRDARCLFMEMIVGRDTVSSSTTYREQSKSGYYLCLAILAPRKGIVEVWQMRIGPRLLVIQCATGSMILQPTPRFGSLIAESSYVPLEVFLLNGDSGQISVINRSLI